jgi:hypothetical protein
MILILLESRHQVRSNEGGLEIFRPNVREISNFEKKEISLKI